MSNRLVFYSLLSFVFFKFSLIGQKNKIVLLPGSEIAEYNQLSGIHKLYRNVRFENQENTIYCDSAIFNERTNRIRSFGNIQIQKGEINIYCDSLDYATKNKYAKLWGNVRARDMEYKITSDSMDYDLSSGKAIFRNKGIIESIKTNEKIQSTLGYFYPKSKDFFFSKDVHYVKDNFSIKTDTLQFNYKNQLVFFHGYTEIENDTIRITCQNGFYHVENNDGQISQGATIKSKNTFVSSDTINFLSKGNELLAIGNSLYKDDSLHIKVSADVIYTSDSISSSYCKGNAIIEKIIKTDTLFFSADSMVINKDSSNLLSDIKAFKKLKVFHKDFTILGDTGTYIHKNKSIHCTNNPIMWSNKTELKGNEFLVFLNDSTLDSALINKNCSVIAEIDSGKFYNQVYGEKIKNYFSNKNLRKSIIQGNAETYFYPMDENRSDSLIRKTRYGLNKLSSSSLTIHFNEREVEKINYKNNPQGIFIPMNKLDNKNKLHSNFQLSFEKKPTLLVPESFKQ